MQPSDDAALTQGMRTWSSRQMEGNGYTDVVTTTASPGFNTWRLLPSNETWALACLALRGNTCGNAVNAIQRISGRARLYTYAH